MSFGTGRQFGDSEAHEEANSSSNIETDSSANTVGFVKHDLLQI